MKRLPKTVHCVTLGPHYKGKMFEIITNSANAWAVDAEKFTVEAWKVEKCWEDTFRGRAAKDQLTIKKGDMFMMLDGISITERPYTGEEIEANFAYWHLSAEWWFLVLYKGRTWMFGARRTDVMPFIVRAKKDNSDDG